MQYIIASDIHDINPSFNIDERCNYPSFTECVALFKGYSRKKAKVFLVRSVKKEEKKDLERRMLYEKIRQINKIRQKILNKRIYFEVTLKSNSRAVQVGIR